MPDVYGNLNIGVSPIPGSEKYSIQLDWPAADGAYYFVEHTEDLLEGFGSIKLFAGSRANPEGKLGLGLQSTAPMGFYRLFITDDENHPRLLADDDGDKISNLLEAKAGWDAYEQPADMTTDADPDGPDGLPDYWEQFHFGNLNQDGTGDADGDGVSNKDEFNIGDNPEAEETERSQFVIKFEIIEYFDEIENYPPDEEEYYLYILGYMKYLYNHKESEESLLLGDESKDYQTYFDHWDNPDTKSPRIRLTKSYFISANEILESADKLKFELFQGSPITLLINHEERKLEEIVGGSYSYSFTNLTGITDFEVVCWDGETLKSDGEALDLPTEAWECLYEYGDMQLPYRVEIKVTAEDADGNKLAANPDGELLLTSLPATPLDLNELYKSALVVYYKDVTEVEGNARKLKNFDIKLEVPLLQGWLNNDAEADLPTILWAKKSGPEDSGTLVDADKPTASFRNPTKGGLYEFELSINGVSISTVPVWLLKVDLDIVHPATGELDEVREDTIGGYVAKEHRTGIQTKLRLHPVDIDGASFRLKFDSDQKYRLLKEDETEIVSESTVFPADEASEIIIEGSEYSEQGTQEEIILQLVLPGGQVVDGDSVKFSVVPAQFEVFFKAFIPYQWVRIIGHPLFDGRVVAKGDYRDFADDVSASTRMGQVAIIIPYPDLDANGIGSITGEEFAVNWTGTTEHYDYSDLTNIPIYAHQGLEPQNVFVAGATPSDSGIAATDEMHILPPSNRNPNANMVTISFNGSAGEPIVIGAWPIDYEIDITIDSADPLAPTFKVTGWQDGFPAYEGYARPLNLDNGSSGFTPLYQWKPPLSATVLRLGITDNETLPNDVEGAIDIN